VRAAHAVGLRRMVGIQLLTIQRGRRRLVLPTAHLRINADVLARLQTDQTRAEYARRLHDPEQITSLAALLQLGAHPLQILFAKQATPALLSFYLKLF